MKVLFMFYVPSGGVDTLNRQRCLALRGHGVECHCLYIRPGAGIQNAGDIPTFVTSNEAEIGQLIQTHGYTAIIVVSAYEYIPFIRQIGYTGIIIFEVQGYGPQDQARQALMQAQPYVLPYVNGVLNPNTPHITALFEELFPNITRFGFNNSMDTHSFTYRGLPPAGHPVIAWLGRFERGDNKNWREFLMLTHHLVHVNPAIQLWMFEDINLSVPEERAAFYDMLQLLNVGANTRVLSNIPHPIMADYFSIIGDSGGFLCLTSKTEGAPYAVIEAMSCRCPVLSTDIDGVRSSLIHNVTGKVYPMGDITSGFYEALELMQNTVLRNALIHNAQVHVRQEFSPEKYCREFIGMLRALTN
ncbi:glycosyltransferase family 4 protein [Paenibacillus sp. JX-17]|uniref:Glycosyltransferase family 4 protein n=1 Tax=Paenibacillus lacisoli TaxID=3064525 RepID=A0ABT9CCI5_9BACL|nr:glycosyltransferase family 4 protein [Paenibacillus sp. JX-17]MDO7906980.1 glycosyltransferase family 4 protein [Paenibacillus sp. JX-17]